jgi:hypothetical protein
MHSLRVTSSKLLSIPTAETEKEIHPFSFTKEGKKIETHLTLGQCRLGRSSGLAVVGVYIFTVMQAFLQIFAQVKKKPTALCVKRSAVTTGCEHVSSYPERHVASKSRKLSYLTRNQCVISVPKPSPILWLNPPPRRAGATPPKP